MKAYTLKKRKDTDEFHLFVGDFTHPDGCNSNEESICKKMTKKDSSGNIFTCNNENSARTKCAEKGRKVCGICVSHLYTTY